jgi:biopolymer transport protein TolR
MAIGVTSSGGGRSGRRGRRGKPMSEPNVIPLVDVMLVLLIIFMVAAPLLTAGIKVDLPKTAASEIKDPVEPLTISIRADGKVFLQETETEVEELPARLKAMLAANPNLPIYVRSDKTVPYERVAIVMGLLNYAGIAKVALVFEPLPGK